MNVCTVEKLEVVSDNLLLLLPSCKTPLMHDYLDIDIMRHNKMLQNAICIFPYMFYSAQFLSDHALDHTVRFQGYDWCSRELLIIPILQFVQYQR